MLQPRGKKMIEMLFKKKSGDLEDPPPFLGLGLLYIKLQLSFLFEESGSWSSGQSYNSSPTTPPL